MAGDIDPIATMRVQLYEAQMRQQQAEQQLELARIKKETLGRTAIPTVFTQIQERAQKAAQQREKNERAGAEGQARAQAGQVMPMTDVTGMPRTGTGAGIAADILKATLGGGGIRRAGQVPTPGGPAGQTQGGSYRGAISGIFGQAQPPAAAAPATTPPPDAASQAAAPAAPSVPQPGEITITPSGVPGIATATQHLTTGQKWGAAGVGILELIARRGEAINSFREFATGERELGQVPVPTTQELAAPYVSGLAELKVLQQRSTDPNVISSAEQLAEQHLEQIRKQAVAYGIDPQEAVDAATAGMTAGVLEINRKLQDIQDKEERAKKTHREQADYELELRKDAELYASGLAERRQIAKERRRAETPKGQLEQQTFDAVQKFTMQGAGALSLAERAALPPAYQRAIEKDEAPNISAAERGRLEKQVEMARKMQNNASELAAVWEPEFYGWNNKLAAWRLQAQENAGLPVDPKDAEWLKRVTRHGTILQQLESDRKRAEAGAQISPAEWKLMEGTSPQAGDSLTVAQQRLETFREYWGLVALRSELALETGYGEKAFSLADEENGGLDYGDMRKLVETFADHAVAKIQLQEPNLDPRIAADRVRKATMNRWGLDVNKYMTPEPVPALR